jgi:hypothetical protein
MSLLRDPSSVEEQSATHTWWVCDRDGSPQTLSQRSLDEALRWAMQRYGLNTVEGRVEIEANDYWYLLVDAAEPTYSQRQVRLTRSDRAAALGWEPL